MWCQHAGQSYVTARWHWCALPSPGSQRFQAPIPPTGGRSSASCATTTQVSNWRRPRPRTAARRRRRTPTGAAPSKPWPTSRPRSPRLDGSSTPEVRMTRGKAFRELKALAAKYNLQFDGYTAKGHYRWRHDGTGRFVVTISEASNWRALKNAERDFKRSYNGQRHHAN